MKTPDFDELLVGYRQATIPALPGSFSADVLRAIRLRRAGVVREAGWFSVLAACLRPGMMTASLCLALLVGILGPGQIHRSGPAMATAGLGLNVFSTANMPSDLLR